MNEDIRRFHRFLLATMLICIGLGAPSAFAFDAHCFCKIS